MMGTERMFMEDNGRNRYVKEAAAVAGRPAENIEGRDSEEEEEGR
jgi:hypothetical protein